MKKTVIFAAIAAFLICPAISLAQSISVKPGIYTLVDGKPIPLNFSYSSSSVEGKNVMGVELAYKTYRFKGETSGVAASDTFIVAINPNLKEVVKKFKEYDPFIKSMKPTKMIIVPLKVDSEAKCREYYPGMQLEGMNVQNRTEMEFDWNEVSENIFLLKVHNLIPGEYAFVFTPTKILGPDFTAIFGFTIPPTYQEQ